MFACIVYRLLDRLSKLESYPLPWSLDSRFLEQANSKLCSLELTK